jgi:hypothetical protein
MPFLPDVQQIVIIIDQIIPGYISLVTFCTLFYIIIYMSYFRLNIYIMMINTLIFVTYISIQPTKQKLHKRHNYMIATKLMRFHTSTIFMR